MTRRRPYHHVARGGAVHPAAVIATGPTHSQGRPAGIVQSTARWMAAGAGVAQSRATSHRELFALEKTARQLVAQLAL
jgi:hypothetical protein